MTQIPRHLLPQIPGEKLGEFKQFLHKVGIHTEERTISTQELKPIQLHVNQEKIDNLMKNQENINKFPLIITDDGHIVDGHHRWVAAIKLEQPTISCIMCDCSLGRFLKLAHKFKHSYVKTVYELTTYGRLAILSEQHQMIKLMNLLNEYMSDGGDDDLPPITGMMTSGVDAFPIEQSTRLFNALGLQKTTVSPEQFHMGLNVELERIDITHGDLKKVALLVLAHIKEDPEYYTKLQQIEN